MTRFVEEMAKVSFQDEDDEIFEAGNLIHVSEDEQLDRRSCWRDGDAATVQKLAKKERKDVTSDLPVSPKSTD